MAVGGTLVTAALLVGAAPAGAAPKFNQMVTVTCPGGAPFVVSVGGNGDWAAARVAGSTTVLHPVAFGAFTGTFTPSGGGAPETFTEPPFARKNAPGNGTPTITCTFHINASSPDGTLSGNGSTTAWAS
jgi:hypothetical protein